MTEPTRHTDRDPRRAAYLVAAAAVLIVAAVLFLLANRNDDDDDPVGAPNETTSTTEATTSTTAGSTTSSAPADVDTTTAVFPFADDSQRFGDPLDAVAAFAEGYLGFVDPLYSDFMGGDSRSGEVGVRPVANGPETIVFVRQLEDGNWWILGGVSDQIVVDSPEALAVLSSPVPVSGRATGFEGYVSAELWTDGADEPLSIARLEAGSEDLAPFDTSLAFDPPSTEGGALVLRSYSGADGSVWAATVLRVQF